MGYTHTYEDVKKYRVCIQQTREYLEKPDLTDQDAIAAHEAIERYEKWIHEAGYQIDYRLGEEPADLPIIAPNLQAEEKPSYTAYFRLDDGTTDACDFYAANWFEACGIARDFLNSNYRERVEVSPYTVVRRGVQFVHYTHGKRPIGKRFARLIGLNECE